MSSEKPIHRFNRAALAGEIAPLGWSCLFVAILLLCNPGCGSSTKKGTPTDDSKPLYVAASWVTSDDNTNTYVAVLDTLDQTSELDFKKAIEIPGYGDAWFYGGWVFVASGETPEVSRYAVVGDELKLDKKISFANWGVSDVAFWNQEFLSPTKAYLADPQAREYVSWNPTTMEIQGAVPWPNISFGGGLEHGDANGRQDERRRALPMLDSEALAGVLLPECRNPGTSPA